MSKIEINVARSVAPLGSDILDIRVLEEHILRRSNLYQEIESCAEL